MKRVQLRLSELFVVEVEDDVNISEIQEALAEQIAKNNELPSNLFWDNLEVVCSECGISIDDGFICGGCEGEE